MKLTEHTEKELALIEEKIRFFRMTNGILAVSVFLSAALLLYKIMKAIIA